MADGPGTTAIVRILVPNSIRYFIWHKKYYMCCPVFVYMIDVEKNYVQGSRRPMVVGGL